MTAGQDGCSFLLFLSFCLSALHSAACTSDSTPLGSACNLTRGTSDKATQKWERKKKTAYFMRCPTSHCSAAEAGGSELRERSGLDGGADEITPVLVAD